MDAIKIEIKKGAKCSASCQCAGCYESKVDHIRNLISRAIEDLQDYELAECRESLMMAANELEGKPDEQRD